MIETVVDEVAAACDANFGNLFEETINPGAAQRDADGTPVPKEWLRHAIQHGLYQHALPRELGGTGVDPLRWGLTVEHIGYRCTDLSFTTLAYLTAATIFHLWESGRDDLIAGYAHPAARGDLLVGFAYTEDHDATALTSRYVPAGNALRLTASKTLITAGSLCDAFVVYAADPDGRPAAILVRTDDPGVDVTPVDVAGLRAAGFARLDITDSSLPVDRLLDTDGLAHAQHIIETQICSFVAGTAGRVRAVAEDVSRRTHRTIRHGVPLADYPNVQSLVGRMFVAVERSRSTLYRALLQPDHPAHDTRRSSLRWAAKHTVTEDSLEVIRLALRLAGTAGFLRNTGYERHLRDVSGLIAGGNPQEKVEIDLGLAFLSTVIPRAERTTA